MSALGKNEVIEETSEFLPLDIYKDNVTAEEILAWSEMGIGTKKSFHAFLTRRERLILEGYNVLDKFSTFSKSHLRFPVGGIPLRWQMILESLREGGIPIRCRSLFQKGYNDVPKRYHAGIMIHAPEGFTDGKLFSDSIASQGLSNDSDVAISKAVGESLERYFLAVYRRRDLRYASIHEMNKTRTAFLNPLSYPQWTNEQKECFPERLITSDSPFGWVEGIALLDNTRIWIPAQMVYWSYSLHVGSKQEPLIMEPNTNGAGAHFTRTEAILSGVREVIQRDAFFLFWLRRVAPPRIDQATITNKESRKLLEEFSRCAFRVEICDLTIDTGEAVIVVGIIDESGRGPAVSIAGGCDRDKELAIQAALYEALACYQGSRRHPCVTILPKNYVPFFSRGIDQHERLLLANNPDRREEYVWFFDGEVRPLLSSKNTPVSAKEALDDILDRFQKKGWPVYCYEVQHPLLKKAGYTVVRIIIPHLISLFLNETNAPLQHSRLAKDFPQDLMPENDREDFNLTPHPFP